MSGRCRAELCFLGLARGTARQLLVSRFMPLGGREQAAALDRWGSGSTEKEGDFPKVTRPPGPSPPPASPPPFKGMPGPGTHAGGLAGAEAGWGESRSPTPPGPLSCRALTRLPGPRQDGRYGGSSPLLLTAPASVCPSVKGVGFRETFWEGLKEALGLSEGACLEASSILLRPLTGCANFKINFRSDEASLRHLRAPQLTSYAGIFRVESLPLSGEGGHWRGEACPGEGPTHAHGPLWDAVSRLYCSRV